MERRDENQLDENLGKEPTGADDVDTPGDDEEEDDAAGDDDLQGADDTGTARESA